MNFSKAVAILASSISKFGLMRPCDQMRRSEVVDFLNSVLESTRLHQLVGKKLNKNLFKKINCRNLNGDDVKNLTMLGDSNVQRIGSSKRSGKVTSGKLLEICGIDRESVDPRFLSSTSVGLLPASFSGSGKSSLCLEKSMQAMGAHRHAYE